MTQLHIHSRQGLPTEMQTLLRDYPRDIWPDHPDFAVSIQNWMGAHSMFRQLAEILQDDTQSAIDKTIDTQQFARRLARFGGMLVNHLHGHHGWEDHQFFPELSRADPRFDRGLEMLENDHIEMNALLDSLTKGANRYLQLDQMSPKDAANELPLLLKDTGAIKGFLDRHLADEEDLVVPILLHHKMRG